MEIRVGGYSFINPFLDCDNFRPSDTKYLALLNTNSSFKIYF
ncbi:MAG: hypothetical protein PHR81_11965 [Bacteroidales bacterium]|jgi:hypothetical protein|nr:hypothetical protein [Bacteroidales bacterium]